MVKDSYLLYLEELIIDLSVMHKLTRFLAQAVISLAISLGWIYGNFLGLGTQGEGAIANFIVITLLPAFFGGIICSRLVKDRKLITGIAWGIVIYLFIPSFLFLSSMVEQKAAQRENQQIIQQHLTLTEGSTVITSPPFHIVLPGDAYDREKSKRSYPFEPDTLNLIGAHFSTEIILPDRFRGDTGTIQGFEINDLRQSEIRGGKAYVADFNESDAHARIYFVRASDQQSKEETLGLFLYFFIPEKDKEEIISSIISNSFIE